MTERSTQPIGGKTSLRIFPCIAVGLLTDCHISGGHQQQSLPDKSQFPYIKTDVFVIVLTNTSVYSVVSICPARPEARSEPLFSAVRAMPIHCVRLIGHSAGHSGTVRIYLIPFLQTRITPTSEPTNKNGATLTKTNSNR